MDSGISTGAFDHCIASFGAEIVDTAGLRMAAPTAEQLLSAAVQAAAAASEAAQALKDSAKSSVQTGKRRFSQASRIIIKQPDHFGPDEISC